MGPDPGRIRITRLARLLATLIALVAMAALLLQDLVSTVLLGRPGAWSVVWAMAAYFTVLTNLIVAVSFAQVAATGRTAPAGWHGGVVLWIGTVGLIYHAVLAGIWDPQGLAWWADQGLHTATPVLSLVWWLAFAPKAPLTIWHPLRWALWPLAYCAYALIRGQATGAHPYPFIDMGVLGATRTALNVLGLTTGFTFGGYLLMWVARRMLGYSNPT
jgi:hypothetical protein